VSIRELEHSLRAVFQDPGLRYVGYSLRLVEGRLDGKARLAASKPLDPKRYPLFSLAMERNYPGVAVTVEDPTGQAYNWIPPRAEEYPGQWKAHFSKAAEELAALRPCDHAGGRVELIYSAYCKHCNADL
jgi:hypothetical protein